MLNSTKRIVAICAMGLLAACGGGGGGGGSDGGTAAGPGAPASPTSMAPAPAMPTANVDFSPVAGLYDISAERGGMDGMNRMTDVGYQFITDQGVIEIYNDLNDDFARASGASMNCFRRAISGDVSFALDGVQLLRNGDLFEVTLSGMVSGMTVESRFRLTPNATGFSPNFSGASSGDNVVRFPNANFNGLGPIVVSGNRTTAISIETIRAMICQ